MDLGLWRLRVSGKVFYLCARVRTLVEAVSALNDGACGCVSECLWEVCFSEAFVHVCQGV